MKKEIFAKHIAEGYKLPKFYGVAWFDLRRKSYVCFPIPLNIVIGFFRNVYFIIIYPKWLQNMEIYVENLKENTHGK